MTERTNDVSTEQMPSTKPSVFFKKADLFVYGVILLICILLFASAIFAKDDFDGIEVLYTKGDVHRVLTYSFETSTLTIEKDWLDYVTVEEQGHTVILKISQKDHSGYNTLVIDKDDKSAYIQFADCSYHKDCTKMSAIKDGKNSIICVPHSLTVRPINGTPKEDLSTAE